MQGYSNAFSWEGSGRSPILAEEADRIRREVQTFKDLDGTLSVFQTLSHRTLLAKLYLRGDGRVMTAAAADGLLKGHGFTKRIRSCRWGTNAPSAIIRSFSPP